MSSVGSRVSSRINFFNGLGLNSRSREDELPFASRGGIQLSEEGFPVEEDNSQILRSSSQSLGGRILSRRHPPAQVVRVNPPNEDNVAPVIASYQIEMKRYQAFSVAAFAGVLAISVFALSSVNKLDDFARAWVIACFAVMIFLSAMTISTAFTNDNGSNDNDVADAHAVQSVYSSRVMIFVQKVCWSAVGKMFIFMACASAVQMLGQQLRCPRLKIPMMHQVARLHQLSHKSPQISSTGM